MSVNDVPRPRSIPQIIGQIVNSVTSRIGIRRLRKGGGILSIIEAAAQSDVKNSQDTFQLLQSRDLDNTTGVALERAGGDDGVFKFQVAKATGLVTVSDTSFEKKATKLFQGAAAPIVGSVVLNVEDASDWPSTGSVYVGRLTPNLEGPLAYTSATNAGAYWVLTLSAATTRFHNRGESVILAQGGVRTIDAGTTVATAQGSLTSAVQFATVFEAEIPDGETSVEDVLVLAAVAGAAGNVEASAVTELPGGAPFPGAAVINPLPFITGRDTEQDDPYRERIRVARNSKQCGIDSAIINAVLGIVAEDESRRCTSAALVRRRGQPSVLFIDDGSGYEEATAGVGIEVVTDSASGGELNFRTLNHPVAKAFLLTANGAPYNLRDSARLSVRVGGTVYTHTFDVSEFNSISAASAYEVVSSINSDSTIEFSARTFGGGRFVVVFARAEENEDIEIVEVASPFLDANDALQFPASQRFTSLLYRNDRLLSKDGRAAVLHSRDIAQWGAFAGSQTLIVAVDQTPAATYTFTDQDFIDAGTGYNTVGRNSTAAWIVVINRKIPGITAAVEGEAITLTSNLGRSSLAKVAITGGSLTGNGLFTPGSASGGDRDYILDRATGDITLLRQASAEDRYTLGSEWTRAFLETASMPAQDLSTDASLWFAVDGSTDMVPHGVGPATELTAAVEKMMIHGLQVSITADAAGGAFNAVEPGDWMLIWDPTSNLPSSLRNYFRVVSVEEDSPGIINTVVFEKRQAAVPRVAHAGVTLEPPVGELADILVCGGYTMDFHSTSLGAPSRLGRAVTDHCEILDVATGAWTPTGKLNVARARHTANLLSNGKVLVVGGFDTTGTALASTELYDPTTGLWTAGPTLAVARADHQAVTLASGRVLICGGWDGTTATATAVEYDPGTNTLINASTMGGARYGHGAVKLPTAAIQSDKVFVACGIDDFGKLATCELYDPATFAWSPRASAPAARAFMGLAVSDTNRCVIIGDYSLSNGDDEQDTWDRYNSSADAWAGDVPISEVGGTVITFADKAVAVTTQDGYPLALGAKSTTSGISKMVHLLYDKVLNTWNIFGDSPMWENEVERCRHVVVPLTGTGAANTTVLHGGASADSLASDANYGLAASTCALLDPGGDPPWTVPDDSTALSGDFLDNRGIAFVRTEGGLNRVVISAGTGFTAPAWVDALNDGLDGATASVYRTSRLRVSTNSFGTSGDLTLVASDSALPPIPQAVTSTNLVPHMASVRAGNSGLGTPSEFTVHHLLYTEDGVGADAAVTSYIAQQDWSNDPPQALPSSGCSVVGLRRWTDGLNPREWQSVYVSPDDKRIEERGNAKGWHSEISDMTVFSGTESLTFPNIPRADKARIGLRHAGQLQYAAHQPVVFASPYAMGPTDDITVVVDGDADTKRFVIPTYRKMRPVDANFDGQIGLADLDGGNFTVNQTFGEDFQFEDFAVHMKARVKTHSATAAKRLLWRYFRHGAEGEFCVLRYLYAEAPTASLAVEITHDQTAPIYDQLGVRRAGIDVLLNSGAHRSAQLITPTSKLGLARCNPTAGKVFDAYAILGYSVVQGERLLAGGLTRLRVQVPNNGTVAQGPQSSGIVAGNVLWVQMAVSSPTTLQSGSFIVDSVGAFNAGTGQQDIYVPINTLHDGTSAWALAVNPCTVSFSSTQETIWDPAVVNGDTFRISGTDLPAAYLDTTMRIVANGRQYLRCRFPGSGSAVTTPVWTTVVNPANLAVFGGPTQTATAIAAAVAALQGTTSTCPVTATVTGTGSGVIDRASWDEADTANFGYQLTDGLNHVQRTVPGGTLLAHTEFLLKDPVSSDLASDADWANEDVRLVPITTRNIVDWFNCPTVSGLFTAAEVSAADAGVSPQIASYVPGRAGSVEVQGGQANAATAAVFGAAYLVPHGTTGINTMRATVRRSEASGFLGGAWVRADNTIPLAKTQFWNSSTEVSSIDRLGLWTFDTAPYTLQSIKNNQRVEIEKVGPYVAVHFPKLANSQQLFLEPTVAAPYDYIYLCAPTGGEVSTLPVISAANRGVFRILRSTETNVGITIWIENAAAIEGPAICKVKALSSDSVVPGDVWETMTTHFGAGNRGAWTVTEVGTSAVGDEMYTEDTLRVDTASATPEVPGAPILFGTASTAVQIRQGVPGRQVFKILGITPNQDDGDYLDVCLDTAHGNAELSAAAGTVLTALDKLAFPAGVWLGVDGYSYDTGLLGLAGKVVYGDKEDEATYPGYAAHGADILFSGPLVKRIKLALGLRVESGLISDDLADRVRSAVAAVVNGTPVNTAVSIGAIIAAAQSIPGVISASPILPAFSSTSDVIPVGAGQKPRILDLRTDISISFVGV